MCGVATTISSTLTIELIKSWEAQKAKKVSIRAFATRQLSRTSNSSNWPNSSKRCFVFRLTFSSTCWRIRLFRSKRLMIFVNSSSSNCIFFLYSSRILFKASHEKFVHDFSKRTYSKHFERKDDFITMQSRSKSIQRSQDVTASASYRAISEAARRRFCWEWDMAMLSPRRGNRGIK